MWQRIEAKLGITPVRSDRDLVRLVEGRLPSQAAASLLAHGLADSELYSLVLPRRTLAHRRARHESLDGRGIRSAGPRGKADGHGRDDLRR